MGTFFLDCIREATIEMMKRDLPEKKMDDFESGPGILPADEFTWEKFLEVSEDMTRITLIPGLIKDVPCTNWDVKYFQDRLNVLNKYNEIFGDMKVGFQRLMQTDKLSSLKAPVRQMEISTVREAMEKFERQEPIFISFDYMMFNRFPSFKEDMQFKQFSHEDAELQNLFMANFDKNILSTAFHGGYQYNFFFNCVGRKKWFIVSPDHLKYLGVFAHGQILFSSLLHDGDEEIIAKYLPMHTVQFGPGDVFFNPAGWMHAVATLDGFSVGVANRFWNLPKTWKRAPFHQTLALLHYPVMIGRALYLAGFNFLTKPDQPIPLTLDLATFRQYTSDEAELYQRDYGLYNLVDPL